MKKLLLSIFAALSVLSASAEVVTRQTLPSLEIQIFKDKDCIGLISDKGCYWTDLYTNTTHFHINQYGMMNIKDKEEVDKSVFIFSVERKGNNIYLEAKKGLEWKKFKFKLPKDKTTPIIINNMDITATKPLQ